MVLFQERGGPLCHAHLLRWSSRGRPEYFPGLFSNCFTLSIVLFPLLGLPDFQLPGGGGGGGRASWPDSTPDKGSMVQ